MAHLLKNWPTIWRLVFIPVLRGSPREGNDNPLQFSCLGNSMDREVLCAIVHGVTKSQTQLTKGLTPSFIGYSIFFN